MNLFPGKPLIIADIGSNWNRANNTPDNLALAKRSIEAAAKAGVNAVKFQYYTHKELYGISGDEKYSLPKEWLIELKKTCDLNNVEFMCTAFSKEGVATVDEYVQIHKVASCEMKDILILEAIAITNKPFIVSTGAAHWAEVKWLIEFMRDMSEIPFTILECVAAYPAEPSDYNIATLHTWGRCGVTTGLSDHTLTPYAALVAIGYGAMVFEKHFDAFKSHGLGETPDSLVSIGPLEMEQYVTAIKTGFSCLGKGEKRPLKCEDLITLQARRRVICTKRMEKGETLILNENFGNFRSLKKDERGAPPETVDKFQGKVLAVDKNPGDSLWFDDIV